MRIQQRVERSEHEVVRRVDIDKVGPVDDRKRKAALALKLKKVPGRCVVRGNRQEAPEVFGTPRAVNQRIARPPLGGTARRFDGALADPFDAVVLREDKTAGAPFRGKRQPRDAEAVVASSERVAESGEGVLEEKDISEANEQAIAARVPGQGAETE